MSPWTRQCKCRWHKAGGLALADDRLLFSQGGLSHGVIELFRPFYCIPRDVTTVTLCRLFFNIALHLVRCRPLFETQIYLAQTSVDELHIVQLDFHVIIHFLKVSNMHCCHFVNGHFPILLDTKPTVKWTITSLSGLSCESDWPSQ
jgi:hypothetical protein